MTLLEARPGDEGELLALLAADPLYNVFLIAPLERGLGPDAAAWLWPAAGSAGAVVLVRWHFNWFVRLVAAGPAGPADPAFPAAVAAIIDAHPAERVGSLNGRPDVVTAIAAQLQGHQGALYRETFAVLDGRPRRGPAAGAPRRARPDDLDWLAALYANAGSLARSRGAVEGMLARTWVVEVPGGGGELAAAAAVHFGSRQAALLGAFYTAPAHRRRGYAAALARALSADLVAADKRPCLEYSDPAAGRVYHRAGFRDHAPLGVVLFRTF